MIKHYWTVVTKKSSINPETNSIILGEVIEEVQVKLPEHNKEKFDQEVATTGFVRVAIPYEIVSYLESEEAEAHIAIQAELPNGVKHWLKEDIKLNIGENKRTRNRLLASYLPVNGRGRYLIRVLDKTRDNIQLAEVPLFVSFPDPKEQKS